MARLCSDAIVGLYCGDYSPDAVFRALTRHSLYADKIILPDPFMYAPFVADKYSPLVHPEEHRMTTIKWTFLWWSLFPWIESELVAFIRTPGDFSPTVLHEILDIQRDKFEATPELKAVMEEEARKTAEADRGKQGGLTECMWLMRPDSAFRKTYSEMGADKPWKTVDEFLDAIRERRAAHPYYVDRAPGASHELIHDSSGASYEAAKRVCAIAGYHLVTDRRSRWMEMELDHEHAPEATRIWSPFAKALQNANLSVLDGVQLKAVLRLRQERRLEGMRSFFNRLWRSCREAEPYADANATHLASGLDEHVRKAEEEWKKIDIELLKWAGTSLGPLLGSSVVGFFPAAAATVVGGVASLALAGWKRRSFQNRFPAGFFLSGR